MTMGSIAIVTDSAADLPASLIASHGITVVPLSIRFGAEEFTDGVDITPTEFWAKCKANAELPETAAPSPGAFQAAFEAARDAGAEGVACITLSSGLSGTYQSALMGAEGLAPFPVTVIDSRAVSMAEGILVILAAQAAAQGADLKSIAEIVTDAVSRVRVMGVIDTMEHLQKGGRVGSAKALMGSVLSIKPILQLKDGVVAEESRQRTRSKALSYLADKVRSEGPLEWVAVVHGAAPDIDDIVNRFRDLELANPLVVGDIGPVVGTHGGPGILGVCYLISAKA